MTKIPEPDGYTRNQTQMGRVYPIPDGYWAGYEITFENFRGYGSGAGLGDSRPDYFMLYYLYASVVWQSCFSKSFYVVLCAPLLCWLFKEQLKIFLCCSCLVFDEVC
ncbi:hypothetical protein Hanom_Chr16g01468121 [Helianthus anomalus]